MKISLHIPKSNSLKHKRMILNSFKSRMRNDFNISLSEVDHQDLWQRSDIAICFVRSEKKHIQQTEDALLKFVDRFNGVELIEKETEIL
ncbi:MAG: DUF503 domain-containing protein [Candidatus Omnitrophica bacterium]|nr:DUF503 domain-containing protein [Candidatus Omnitrophota bacterium]